VSNAPKNASAAANFRGRIGDRRDSRRKRTSGFQALFTLGGVLSVLEELSMTSRVVGLELAACLFLTLSAFTQEKKIQRSDLPAAVEKTVVTQSRGAIIRDFSEEKENGQTFYETELVVNGHSKDVLMDANGVVVEVEEQVALDSLPTVVRDGLQAKAVKGKLIKVESITKHDKLVAYEAKVVTDGKKSEVQVGPDGKPLDHEE
jgi:uncharacterized membrane protein YkoI